MSEYVHGKLYVYDAATQTFDPVVSVGSGRPEIIATSQDVSVCGVRVERPEGIAPSQWLGYWRK